MEAWMTLVLLSIALSFVTTIVLSNLRKKKRTSKLPPGPPSIPIISTILWLKRSISDINAIFRELRVKYGSTLTLRIASRTVILIANHSFAHKALVQGGAAFADRPPVLEFKAEIIGRHLINQSPYGPMWRLLRGNLTSKLLHPSRVKLFAEGRRWALRILVNELERHAKSAVDGDGDGVVVASSYLGDTIFKLMLLMCFGKKVEEKATKEIKAMLRCLELGMKSSSIFAFCPKITKLLFRSKWNDLLGIRRKNLEIFIPLIREREGEKQRDSLCPYVDSLLELQVSEEGGRRRLTDDEVVSLCSELILVGADTTATALEWIMAELVVHQEVQKKLLEEIESVVEKSEEMEEEDLLKMPYLNAVVMEGLRRHPLSHFGPPHAVTEAIVEIGGYVIPKDAMILFMLAEMGWDEKVWEEPMEFKPERFFGSRGGGGVDITGSREIKMMPFGAGRRICPGLGLAMLHLQFFVANLVREFEWDVVEGEEVDLSEKSDITLAMKNPLRARITARTSI